ncbi:DinB family protein [Aquirufa sp. ROCK-SH2]
MHPPLHHEFPNERYFAEYLNFTANENLFEVLEKNALELRSIYENLTPHDWNFAYQTNKWTRIQLLGHIIDTERIFSYRALAISRGEKQSLPGFDENSYLVEAQFEVQNPPLLLQQYTATRTASICLFQSFNEVQWNKMGQVNNFNISVRALAWMIAGHEKHHLKVLREKYELM